MKFTWGWLYPYRTLIVLNENSYNRYHFRFGKLKKRDFFKVWNPSIQDDEFLINTFTQELHQGLAPPLKYFDRFHYLYQFLTDRFGTSQWLGYKWLSARNYLAARILAPEKLPKISHFAQIGALVGELTRFQIFPEGTGLILVPTREGKIHQIYLCNHIPVFMRLREGDNIDWKKEIESLKRHLERYYQAETENLPLLWWGKNPPLPEFILKEGVEYEEALVCSAALHGTSALPCFPQIPSSLFARSRIARVLRKSILFLGLSGVILNFYAGIDYGILLLKGSKPLVSQTFESILPDSNSEPLSRIEALYIHFHPLQDTPLKLLKRLKPLLDSSCQLQEIFWGRGQTTIDSQDLTMKFTGVSLETASKSQTFVLGISGSQIQDLYLQEKALKKVLGNQSIKFWEIQEDVSAISDQGTCVTGLIQYQEDHP